MAHRALGYVAVDAVVDRLTTLRDQPVGGPTASRDEGRPWDQVLARDPSLLHATFAITSAVVRDAARDLEEVNVFEYGVQLTRAAR